MCVCVCVCVEEAEVEESMDHGPQLRVFGDISGYCGVSELCWAECIE